MTRGDAQHLADIRDASREIAAVVALGRQHFFDSKIHQRGVERLLEIIGEATQRLSDAVRERHPEIAWKDIAGLRVLLAHRYHRIDPEQVWVIAARDVPTLLEAMQVEPREPRDRPALRPTPIPPTCNETQTVLVSQGDDGHRPVPQRRDPRRDQAGH